MSNITRNQLAAFYALLTEHGLRDDKEDIVRNITNNRTCSASQLTFKEAQDWIKAMNEQKKPKEDPRQRMVKHIIAMATEIGFVKWVQKVGADGKLKMVRDYTDLHAWILKYGYLHKKLNDYTYEELPTLVTAFKNVYLSKLNAQK
ncbi:hypothetical protein ESA94_20345 [Lacibacter luteus]|uniref:Uncharacterized protein n=1 Tax=Lacibacter luteus TaxID=2508719 RepID=A0A4Q1CDF9_9BACT|nr:hypothetical protein [Lacibacter luteus]RXK57551.1 hypothetical protein ESA94_20345 [Lacibacter luteus]